MENKVEEGGILIAEVMGLKSFEDGRYGLMYPNPLQAGNSIFGHSGLKYSSSWDWQIPAWSKVAHAVRDIAGNKDRSDNDGTNYYTDKYFRWCDKYESAVFSNDPLKGFEIIVEMIKWINEIKK